MKTLSSFLTALLLAATIAPHASAGAPPRVDPNAPKPEYWEPEPEPVKKTKKDKDAKKDKKSDDKR
jgi:hypothetical protein